MSGMTLGMTVLVLINGAILAATPYLMPPTECFTVSVPPSAKTDSRVRRFYARYVILVVLVSLVCAVVAALAANSLVTLTLALIAPEVAAFLGMLFFRSKVQALKARENWGARSQRVAAFIAEREMKAPIPLAWNLLYLVIAAAMAAFALAVFDRFPEQIPMQIDLDGQVSRYAEKSLGAPFFPAAMSAFMGVVFTLSHWMIVRSKRPIDPAAPASSALAYGQFTRTQSILLLLGGLTLCAAIGITFFLTSLEILPMSSAGPIMLTTTIVFLVAEGIFAFRQGQSGARLATELRTSNELAADDDAHWLLGSFYCNADDPSFVVPKRFGVGWTINVANKRAWLLFGLLIFVCVVFLVGMSKLGG